jgi:hypothetical protein
MIKKKKKRRRRRRRKRKKKSDIRKNEKEEKNEREAIRKSWLPREFHSGESLSRRFSPELRFRLGH